MYLMLQPHWGKQRLQTRRCLTGPHSLAVIIIITCQKDTVLIYVQYKIYETSCGC